jgi:hypothetical protein
MLDTRSEVLPYNKAYGLLHCIRQFEVLASESCTEGEQALHDTELRKAKSWMKKCEIKRAVAHMRRGLECTQY